MNDFFISIKDWFKDRVSSPFYSVFIFSVIVHNWKFFYIFFGPNNVDLLDLKLKYLENSTIEIQFILLSFIIIPFIYTVFIISIVPFFAYYAFKIRDCHMNRVRISHKESELRYEESVSNIVKKIADEKEKQSGAKNTIQQNMSDVDKWEEEIRNNKNEKLILSLRRLNDIIYKTSGRYNTNSNSTDIERTYISPENLSTLDVNNLVKIDNLRSTIEINDKGRYFLKKFIN